MFSVTLSIFIPDQREEPPVCLQGHPFPTCIPLPQIRCTYPAPRVTGQAMDLSRMRTKSTHMSQADQLLPTLTRAMWKRRDGVGMIGRISAEERAERQGV